MRGLVLGFAVALCGVVSPLHATSDDNSTQPTAPTTRQRTAGTGVAIGLGRLFPSLGLTLGHDSNLNLSGDAPVSSNFFRLSPGVRWEGGNERSRFGASYEAELVNYSSSSLDNYRDQRVSASWLYNPVLRHAFALDASMMWDHDQRGTAAREGSLGDLNLDPDRFRRDEIGAQYRFGAPGARGRLEFSGRAGDVRYANNRQFTAFRDRQDQFLSGAFYWRFAPKTSGLARVEYGHFDYDRATLDSDERHYYVGVEFDATAKTSGSILVGRVAKHFADAARSDFSGASWRGNLEWRPRSYSIFTLSTGRETDETNGFGDLILRRDLTLGWAHNWSDRFRTTVDLGVAREEQLPTTRVDNVDYYGLSADYVWRRWMRFGASWRGYQRDSDVREFDYDRNLYMLSAEASF